METANKVVTLSNTLAKALEVEFFDEDAKDFAQCMDEFIMLLELMLNWRIQSVLEIGTLRGSTTYAFAQIMSPFEGKVITIDLFDKGPYRWERKPELKSRITSLILNSHHESTVTKVKELLNGDKVDMVFIDGDHRLQSVMRDYQLYNDLATKVVVLHDIQEYCPPTEGDYGVPYFWNYIKRYYLASTELVGLGGWSIGHTHMAPGIGILYKDPSLLVVTSSFSKL